MASCRLVPYVPNELLGRLVGMRLIAIEFILDYLVLRFDGDPSEPQATLSCYVFPYVEAPDGTRRRGGEAGYSDALRALVGADVVATEEQAGAGLRIQVGCDSIVIDPTSEDLFGPEIALLHGFRDRAWMCWRPGEDAFEHLR